MFHSALGTTCDQMQTNSVLAETSLAISIHVSTRYLFFFSLLINQELQGKTNKFPALSEVGQVRQIFMHPPGIGVTPPQRVFHSNPVRYHENKRVHPQIPLWRIWLLVQKNQTRLAPAETEGHRLELAGCP